MSDDRRKGPQPPTRVKTTKVYIGREVRCNAKEAESRRDKVHTSAAAVQKDLGK
jgi:hypothetical protein